MRRSRVPISPLLAWALSAMFAAAVSGGILRYRAPFDATLTLLAAIGIWYAIGDWSRAGTARLPAVAALPNEEASDDTSAHDAGADEHESAAADS
jgi:hypothetical protein